MSKNVKVSVIMPVYNAKDYIEDTIDSILRQTFEDFEFLIIDDCSTDESYELMSKYSDDRIKLFRNDENLGYIKTLNLLLKIVRGEYVVRQDNDDISLPSRIEKQVEFMESNLDVGVCGSNALLFGNLNKKTFMPTTDIDCKVYMIFNNPVLHPTSIIRKSVLNKFGQNVYDGNFMPAEDFYLWLQISKFSKIVNLPDTLIKYRVHSNNTSSLNKQLQISKLLLIRSDVLKHILGVELSERENFLLSSITYEDNFESDNLIEIEEILLKLLKVSLGSIYFDHIRFWAFYFWVKICIKNQHKVFSFSKIFVCLKSELFKFKLIFKRKNSAIFSKLSFDYIN
jgi:glycosyltransferase involved in cell wall biosynthesis